MKITIAQDCDFLSVLDVINHPSYETFILGSSTIQNLKDTTVEPNHINLSYQNGAWYANDCSQYGAYIRIPSNASANVEYGRYLLFGKTWLDTSDPSLIKIVDSAFHAFNSFVPVLNKEVTFGRGIKGENIQSPLDITVSGNHAKILFRTSDMLVTDWKEGHGSSNGSYYSLKNNYQLKQSTIIRIGLETFAKFEFAMGTLTQNSPGKPLQENMVTYDTTVKIEQQKKTGGDTVKIEQQPKTGDGTVKIEQKINTFVGASPNISQVGEGYGMQTSKGYKASPYQDTMMAQTTKPYTVENRPRAKADDIHPIIAFQNSTDTIKMTKKAIN